MSKSSMSSQSCVLLFFELLLYFHISSYAATIRDIGCSLNVFQNPNERVLPVLLHNRSTQFELVVPKQGHINLTYGEGITLSCPNLRNSLLPTNSQSSLAICMRDTTLRISGELLNFDALLCKIAVRGAVEKTEIRCGNKKGKIINIGYQITTSSFITLIRVCHDEQEGNTLYSEHSLHGEEIKYASKSSLRPSFSTAGLGPGIAADVAYKKAFQKSTFNQLLGSALVAERYISNSSYLARGHLSPDADFLFASGQFTTYFYINACPKWQAVNGGNWVRVENAMRRAADHYHKQFKIFTGTHGILKLPNDRGDQTPIYLVSGDKLPVPKFIWKIMYDEESKKGIAVIALNNPFVEEITQEDILCSDICKEHGWFSNTWSNLRRGYTYCCRVDELARVVKSVPILKVSGVLDGTMAQDFDLETNMTINISEESL